MSKADELLRGRPLTRATYNEIQNENRAELGVTDSGCISALKRDPAIAAAVDELKERLLRKEDIRSRSIPEGESPAMQRERVLDFDQIVQWKKDPRYSDPGQRDKQFVAAVDAAVKELSPGSQPGAGELRPGVAEKKTLLNGNYE